jgi:hypothetical protein
MPAYVCIRQHSSAYVSTRQHTSAYVSIREVAGPMSPSRGEICRTRQHTSVYNTYMSAYVSICQHMSAYVKSRVQRVPIGPRASAIGKERPLCRRSLRPVLLENAEIRAFLVQVLHPPGESDLLLLFAVQRKDAISVISSCIYVSIRQHTSAYVSIRQHTSAYVSIRQTTSSPHH